MHLTQPPSTCSDTVRESAPRTLTEFRDHFVMEKACIAYLAALKWPDGFLCPQCDGSDRWKMSRGLFLCRKRRRLGDDFPSDAKPLRLWLEAMWHITNQKYGANALGLQRILETYIRGKSSGKREREADNKVLVVVAVENTAAETGKKGWGASDCRECRMLRCKPAAFH